MMCWSYQHGSFMIKLDKELNRIVKNLIEDRQYLQNMTENEKRHYGLCEERVSPSDNNSNIRR